MVIIIVLNLIFGVIIDTFADLRSEKQKKEEILKTTCFICGECAAAPWRARPWRGPLCWRSGQRWPVCCKEWGFEEQACDHTRLEMNASRYFCRAGAEPPSAPVTAGEIFRPALACSVLSADGVGFPVHREPRARARASHLPLTSALPHLSTSRLRTRVAHL